MALRVLLADESSTIKKAMQMALSDFGVEVKSVPSGLDVLSVAHTFKPDVVLADILLTKKNGYEVCHELKTDTQTKHIPVILMWSSFMQLDQAQFNKVRAEASLEKPFDSETLRALIEKYVTKLTQFPLKGLLNHPPLPDFEDSDTFIRQKAHFTSNNQATKNPSPVIEDVEEDHFSLSPPPKSLFNSPQNSNEADDWTTGNNQFVVETESLGDFEEVTVVNANPNTRQPSSPDLQKRIQEQVSNYLEHSPVAQSKSQNNISSNRPSTHLDEQLLREEVRQLAEKICWQVIPEITEKIVREELGKLLKDIEKSI